MLEVVGLKKHYGAVAAVKDVTFRVGAGESVGLLGPNGAGKTTTVSMIVGLVKPDQGQVLIEGKAIASDTDPIKRKLGYVPQDLALYEEMSARSNLELFGALYGLSGTRLEEALRRALELVKLTDRGGDKVSTFSGGMKRRLNLAAALLHDPQILLLDEPTVGVDPQSRNAIFENLESLHTRGVALLYTTHYMEEAERLCDRIVIIDQGAVLADDTLRGLYQRQAVSNRISVELEEATPGPWLDRVRALTGVLTAELDGQVLTVQLQDLVEGAPRVLSCLCEQNRRYNHFSSERAGLESVFLSLTGRTLRDS
jgi:ABC-2 type transport system ATP-binding protein